MNHTAVWFPRPPPRQLFWCSGPLLAGIHLGKWIPLGVVEIFLVPPTGIEPVFAA